MGKATDKRLGELHGKLAESMLKSLTDSDTATSLLDSYGQELPAPVAEFLSGLSNTSPSLLTAITKFLKDNDITCSIDDSNQLTELEQRLAAKERRKRVGNVVPFGDE